MCCTRLAEIQDAKTPKIRHLRRIAQFCRSISLQLWHVSTIDKIVKQHYLLQMLSQYGELWPTNGWDPLESLGHPSKFQSVSRLAFATAPTSLTGGQPNRARSLAVSWAGTLYVYIFGGSCPLTEFCPVQKFTLRPSLAFSSIGSVTARHASSGR